MLMFVLRRFHMFEGTITYDSGRGFFWYEQDLTHTSVFIHQSSVKDRRQLHLADRVRFALEPNPKRPGELQGVRVEYLGRTIAIQRSAPKLGGVK
jgi:cold shock CspA family protein